MMRKTLNWKAGGLDRCSRKLVSDCLKRVLKVIRMYAPRVRHPEHVVSEQKRMVPARGKVPKAQMGPVIELTDSESDEFPESSHA